MIKALYLIISVFLISGGLVYKSLAQGETELAFPMSDLEEIITKSGVEIDREITTDNNGSIVINANTPVTVELFEPNGKDFKNKRLTYKAQMRSENLIATEEMRGISYIELIAQFPDGDDLVSRAPRVPTTRPT